MTSTRCDHVVEPRSRLIKGRSRESSFARTPRGLPLNQTDLILTLMLVHSEKGREEPEALIRAVSDPAIKAASHPSLQSLWTA